MSTGPDLSNAGCLELLHDPEIVLLDEPTIGLDVVAKERIRGFVRERNRERGSTVVLTTHDMSDVERLCERVVVIDHGRLLFDGDLELMRRRFGAETVLVVDLEEPGPPLALPGTRVARVEGPRQWLHFRREQVSAARVVAQVAASARVRDLALQEPAIEDVVRRIYLEGTGR